MRLTLLILSSLLTFSLSFAGSPKNLKDALKKGLVKPAVTDPLINEVVSYLPIKDHHFNLEAPQECGESSTIDPSARKVTCQFHKAGEKRVRLSVCDNAKKYCKQELINVAVRPQKSGTPRIKVAPQQETVKMQNKTKKLLMTSFKSMSPDEAKQAVSTKKAALVMFSTDWCPPCNQAKEFLLPTPRFKEATKDLLMIYVDGDNPTSDAWKPFLKASFYPTFVVLNKNLESIALFSESGVKESTDLITEAQTNLNDSYSSLESRINARLSGGLIQKAKDLFSSQEQIKKDQGRLLTYLESRGKFDEQISYMKKFSETDYKDQIITTEQKRYLYGKSDEKLSEEDNKTKKEVLTRTVLDMPIDENSLYPYIAQDFCATNMDPETKAISKDCSLYLKKYSKHLENNKNKGWEAFTEAEKLLSMANTHQMKAMIAESLNKPKQAEKHYTNCFKTYNDLYQYSPLKEKSRSVRLQQLYCLKGDDNSKQAFTLLSSLVKDYPFEETFQRKLASHYLKKKKYKKAAEYNENALKYSYGAMWAYNMSAKAKILQGLKKDKDALKTLSQALEEIVLEKEGRASRSVKMLRGQYEALKAKLSKGSI